MPRPRKCRRVQGAPRVDYFKPRGIPLRSLEEEVLSVEGFEALRLSDLEGLTNDRAAEIMRVSRHTFGRVLAEARKAVSSAIVRGAALRIEGGSYEIPQPATNVDGGERGACRAPGAPRESKEEPGMQQKIAVTSEGPAPEDLVDPRFGRAAGFFIYDPDTQAASYLDNGAAQARGQGAGIMAAESVARAGAKVVLTGYVGPKAFAALSAVGIAVVQDLGGLTVKEALRRYAAGEAVVAQGPNR